MPAPFRKLDDPLNAIPAFDHPPPIGQDGDDGLIAIIAFPTGEIRQAFGG
jgi:hypothetical protein